MGVELIHAALMAAFALREAEQDAIDIDAHRPIDHVSGWLERCFFAVVCAAVLALIATTKGAALLPTLASLVVLSYGVFTPVFRWRLNSLRRKSWDYVSLSNLYDTAFISAFGNGAGAMAYAVEIAAAVVAFII